jgi:hypothetical protein
MNKFALTIAIIAGTTLAAAVVQAAGPEVHVETSSALLWMMLAGAVLAIAPQPILKAIKIKV